MKIQKFISNLNPFKKKKEKEAFPNKFALIRLTNHAKESGIEDEENKVIEIYKRGKLLGVPKPYTEELVRALEEVEEIPVIEEKFKEEDEFVFDESTSQFGSVERIR